jgi:DNA-binding GntR family transcriptional regulator
VDTIRQVRRTNAGAIGERLRKRILRGELRPGQHLVQEELAADLGVSRIPLREALHGLAAEGLVTVVPQRGMMVAELDRADVAELFDLRLELEPELANEAVRGCRARDVDELRTAVDRMRRTGSDAAARATENHRFHRHVYALAERRLTLRLVDQLLHLAEPYSRRWVRSGNDLDRIDAEHDAIVDALATNDPGALRTAITTHLTGARDHVLAAFERTDEV